jgi:hypothetical protein
LSDAIQSIETRAWRIQRARVVRCIASACMLMTQMMSPVVV